MSLSLLHLPFVGAAAHWSASSPAFIRQRWSRPGFGGFVQLIGRGPESVYLSNTDLPLPRQEEVGMNVSQDSDRQRAKVGRLHCLTPGAKPLLLSRCCVLHRVGFVRSHPLNLQNGELIATRFKNASSQDLGGTLFHLFPCAATLFAVMVGIALGSA